MEKLEILSKLNSAIAEACLGLDSNQCYFDEHTFQAARPLGVDFAKFTSALLADKRMPIHWPRDGQRSGLLWIMSWVLNDEHPAWAVLKIHGSDGVEIDLDIVIRTLRELPNSGE